MLNKIVVLCLLFSSSLFASKSILFIMPSMDVGGTERAFISLINNMPFNGASVDLCLLKRGGAFEKLLRKDLSIISWEKARKKTYTTAVSFAQYISPEKWVDAISANKKIQWIHFDPKGDNNRFNVNRAWKKIDAYVTVSEAAKLNFILCFPQFTSKVRAIYNIVDNDLIRKDAQAPCANMTYGDGTVSVVTLARLHRLKALDRAVRIHARLEREGIHFRWYVFGEGNERESLEKAIQSAHLKKRFFLMGNTLNPYPYLAHADIVALFSLEESYGLAMIEAKILHRPLIMTKTAAAKEIIDHNTTGLIVDQTDEAIYQGLRRLILNKPLREHFSSNIQGYSFDNSPTYTQLKRLFFD